MARYDRRMLAAEKSLNRKPITNDFGGLKPWHEPHLNLSQGFERIIQNAIVYHGRHHDLSRVPPTNGFPSGVVKIKEHVFRPAREFSDHSKFEEIAPCGNAFKKVK